MVPAPNGQSATTTAGAEPAAVGPAADQCKKWHAFGFGSRQISLQQPVCADQKAHPVETEDQQRTLSLKFGLTIKAKAQGAHTDLIGDGQILPLPFEKERSIHGSEQKVGALG